VRVTVTERSWRALAVRGLAAIAFGILTLLWPGITLDVLVLLFGAFVLVDSVFTLLAVVTGAPGARRHRPMLVLESVAGIAIGIITLLWPSITALALLFLIAAWFFVTGGLKLAAAFAIRDVAEHWWLMALSGALSVIVAVALAVWPVSGALAITWLIGWWALFLGALTLAVAWAMRREGEPASRSARPRTTHHAPA
jgi:uncharacterized membrane protein HdeD (DUF308 family)